MIQIEVNRYTIKKLEETIEKWNKEHNQPIVEYVELINKLLDCYMQQKKKKKK